ncbi:hypothetical protein N7453_006696 [Penicillium expansum]|nr:hypothetical protein N7453_006696 [Penicillium expansum]
MPPLSQAIASGQVSRWRLMNRKSIQQKRQEIFTAPGPQYNSPRRVNYDRASPPCSVCGSVHTAFHAGTLEYGFRGNIFA